MKAGEILCRTARIAQLDDAVADKQARHQQSCERQQKGSAAPFRIWLMWMNLIGNARRSPTRGSRARSPGSRRACRGQSPSLHQLVDDRQSGEPRQLYGVSGDQQADSGRQPLFPRRSTFTAAISVRRSDSPVINSAFGGQAGRAWRQQPRDRIWLRALPAPSRSGRVSGQVPGYFRRQP